MCSEKVKSAGSWSLILLRTGGLCQRRFWTRHCMCCTGSLAVIIQVISMSFLD